MIAADVLAMSVAAWLATIRQATAHRDRDHAIPTPAARRSLVSRSWVEYAAGMTASGTSSLA